MSGSASQAVTKMEEYDGISTYFIIVLYIYIILVMNVNMGPYSRQLTGNHGLLYTSSKKTFYILII